MRAAAVRAAADSGDLPAARAALDELRTIDPGHADLASLEERVDQAASGARRRSGRAGPACVAAAVFAGLLLGARYLEAPVSVARGPSPMGSVIVPANDPVDTDGTAEPAGITTATGSSNPEADIQKPALAIPPGGIPSRVAPVAPQPAASPQRMPLSDPVDLPEPRVDPALVPAISLPSAPADEPIALPGPVDLDLAPPTAARTSSPEAAAPTSFTRG
jgi:hypothetical protein